MIALKLFFVYSLGLVKVEARTYITPTNDTSYSPTKIQSIQQCIWDHGIFCIMLDFLNYRQSSLYDDLPQDDYPQGEAIGFMESIIVESTFFTSNDVEEVSPCTSSVITPSTVPLEASYGLCTLAFFIVLC